MPGSGYYLLVDHKLVSELRVPDTEKKNRSNHKTATTKTDNKREIMLSKCRLGWLTYFLNLLNSETNKPN